MKKGFTLIEVLTVILLIGIIGTVVSVNYNRYLEASKKSSFKDSLLSVIDQLEIYQINHPAENYLIAKDIDFTNMNIENKKSLSGKYKVNNNYVILVDVTNEEYCANGNKNDLTIVEGNCK